MISKARREELKKALRMSIHVSYWADSKNPIMGEHFTGGEVLMLLNALDEAEAEEPSSLDGLLKAVPTRARRQEIRRALGPYEIFFGSRGPLDARGFSSSEVLALLDAIDEACAAEHVRREYRMVVAAWLLRSGKERVTPDARRRLTEVSRLVADGLVERFAAAGDLAAEREEVEYWAEKGKGELDDH